MDDRQLTELIQRVLLQIQREQNAGPALPDACLLLPEDWQAQGLCADLLQTLRGSYAITAIVPDGDTGGEALRAAGVSEIVTRSAAVFPVGDCLTVLPIPSRALVVKLALCLQDDFESRWIAQCIARGQPVFMRRESPMFTGLEPAAYQRKIEAYYREAESFGICFDRLPARYVITQQAAPPRAPEPVEPISLLTTADRGSAAPRGKKRIITTQDLAGAAPGGILWLREGDVVSPLAAERAAERGIQLRYEPPGPDAF